MIIFEFLKINSFSEADGLDWESEVDVLPEIKIDKWKEKFSTTCDFLF